MIEFIKICDQYPRKCNSESRKRYTVRLLLMCLEVQSFGSCSTWETNGLPGGTGIVQAEIMASGETVPDLDQNLIMAICTVLF